MSAPPKLRALVVRGHLWRRVLATKAFACQFFATGIINVLVHILAGWLSFTNWGRAPMSEVEDACFNKPPPAPPPAAGVPPGPPVALSGEVWVDATLTAFFVCASQVERIKDVANGKLPLIAPDAIQQDVLIALARIARLDGCVH